MKELDALYQDIQPNIYAFFYMKTSNQAVAEDLTHDVFYEACKNIHSFRKDATLKTWLFSIAKNRLKKHYRSKKYQTSLEDKLAKEKSVPFKTPEEEFLLQEESQHIIQLINQLDEHKKDIAILRIYGELSFKEIGDLIDKSETYARVTFHRIKLQLKKELEGNV